MMYRKILAKRKTLMSGLLFVAMAVTLGIGPLHGAVRAIYYVPGSGPTPSSVNKLPRIAVNATGFYNATTGQTFVPRGANFARLATSPTGLVYHSTFEPGQYNSAKVQAMLTGLKNAKYNTVRVFIDPGEFTATSHGISTGIYSTEPINAAYMANVVDFVKQAGAKGIYTIPIIDRIPANTYYYNIAGSPTARVQGNNILYLDSRYVQAKELYVKEFVSALQAGVSSGTGAIQGGILAYETDNEVFFDGQKPPFNTRSGTLTGLDGLTYDMAQSSQRQQATDASVVVYSARMKQAITSADPQGLLTLGFFTNNAVGKTSFNGLISTCTGTCDPKFPARPASVSMYGKVDFIDMHAYPWSTNYSLKNDLASSEYTLFRKPYMLGEFGAKKSVYSNNITTAAYAMKNLQIASCAVKAKGWIFWSWDTNLVTPLLDQPFFYSLSEGNGAINGQLAPLVRPDPCK